MLQLLLQEVKHINRTLEIQSGSWVLQFHIGFRIVYQIQRFGKGTLYFSMTIIVMSRIIHSFIYCMSVIGILVG